MLLETLDMVKTLTGFCLLCGKPTNHKYCRGCFTGGKHHLSKWKIMRDYKKSMVEKL